MRNVGNARGLFVCAILLLTVETESVRAECQAPHGNGMLVWARERAGPSNFFAHAAWDADGWPAITYGPTYFSLPPLIQQLTRLHECAHLQLRTTNEFVANCSALRVMRQQGLSARDEASIAMFHYQIPVLMGQYGGSGAAFWNGTIQMCGARPFAR